VSLHRFDPEIAKLVGANAATIYENLVHWTKKNEANGRHSYDGKTWTYNSISAFEELFSYLSKDQIRGALKKLLDAGLIEKGNYNKAGYDRTLWYSVKSQMHLVKIPNGVGENPKPIPDNKPDNKPFLYRVREEWNGMARQVGLPEVELMGVDRAKWVLRRLELVDGNEESVLAAIRRVPNNDHWTGANGKGFQVTFDWVFKDPVRFRQALESVPAPQTPKAENDYRPNRDYAQERAEQNSQDLDEAFALALRMS
jgi:hypothetical protein